MGAGASNEIGPLAIAAVAEITRFEVDQLRVLRQRLQVLLGDNREDEEEQPVDDTTNDTSSSQLQQHDHTLVLRNESNLSQVQFEEALESADFFASDRAIFDKLFTLMDRTGDAMIFATEFLIGLCALLKGDLASKLQAAFELLQHQEKVQGDSNNAMVSKDELAFVLITMAQVATYFGDPPMLKANVLSIVDGVFTPLTPPSPIKEDETTGEEPDGTSDPQPNNSSSLSSAEVAVRVVQHHTVDSYIRGHFVRRGTIVH